MTQPGERIPASNLLDFSGKAAVVTGGGMGIGRGIVRRLAETGASVVIADYDENAAKSAQDEVKNSGGKALAVRCDVSDEVSVSNAIDAATGEFGTVSILVNNAGVFPFKSSLEMTVEEWDRVQNVNLRGTFLFSREFSRRLIDNGEGGSIVNIGSIDSFHPSSAGLAAYDASKGGVLMFTRNFALEMAQYGIRVNMVAPGGITTEGTTRGLVGMSPEQAEAMMNQFMAQIPLKRMGTPDDIAKVVLMLASDMASYMTGASVVVDGGALIA